jgi:hypothetical protein
VTPSKNPKIKTPDDLKEVIQQMADDAILVATGGLISRGVLEKRLGFVHGSLQGLTNNPVYRDWKTAVDDIEKDLIKHEGSIKHIHHKYGTPRKLKEKLEFWSKRDNWGDIPAKDSGDHSGDLGHLNIRAITKALGFSINFHISNDWKWATQMLTRFNHEMYELGALGTKWERKVPEFRIVLNELDAKKQLPLNQNGKLNRFSFMLENGYITENISVDLLCRRAPKLKALFEEYDQKLKERGVTAYVGDQYQEKLARLIEDRKYDLNKDHLSINKTKLSLALCNNDNIITHTPSLSALVKDEEKRLATSIRQGKTKNSFNVYGVATINMGAAPYSKKMQKVYDFRGLLQICGLELTEKIATAFVTIIEARKIKCPKVWFNSIKAFMTFMHDFSDNHVEIKQVFDALKSGGKINKVHFEFTCMKFKQVMLEKVRKKTLATKVIEAFGEAKVFPSFKFKSTVKERKRRTDRARRKSIAEASSPHQKVITDSLKEGALKRNIIIERDKDTKDFVKSILNESAEDDMLPNEPVGAIKEITKKRLLEIRRVASNDFETWKINYEKGQAILSSLQQVEINDTLEKFKAYQNGNYRRFPNDYMPIENYELTLKNLLIIIHHNYKNDCPSIGRGTQFWNKQYQKVGGIDVVNGSLNVTKKAATAAAALYLSESGANVAVALTLTLDRLSKSQIANHTRVTGTKARAGGKSIFDDLPNKVDIDGVTGAISAMKYLSEINASYHQGKETSEIGLFGYFSLGKRYNELTEFAFRDAFKRMLKHSDYMGHLNVTPSMLRPTVLLLAQLEDPTNAGLVMIQANHESETTTMGYTNKLPYRVVMEEHMMKYQETLESIFSSTSNLRDESKLAAAQKTGLGVFCKDRLINIDGKESQCNEVQDCVKCKQDRMLVIADKESISDMILWKKSLEHHENDFIKKNPERWEKIWVPWQAFFSVVLEDKMTRGKLSFIKKEALKLAQQRQLSDNYVMPEPW